MQKRIFRKDMIDIENNCRNKYNRAGIENYKAGARPATAIGNIVGAYKSIVANHCLKILKQDNKFVQKVWQRNYYDHIIHDEIELSSIREYIISNPANWSKDGNNSEVFKLTDEK